MNRKVGLILAAVVVGLALGGFFVSPIFAFKALAEAGEAGDTRALADHVDFPAVRADLKVQLQERMMGALARDTNLSRSPFGALGALFAPTIVNQIVDTAVTPEGVARIVQSGRAPMADKGGASALAAPAPAQSANAAPQPAPAPAEKPKKENSFGFTDVNHFRAVTAVADAPPLGWVMERRGLFGWKLVRIELPPA